MCLFPGIISCILTSPNIKIQDGHQRPYWKFNSKEIVLETAGGHLEFLWLDWSKYRNNARNWFSIPKLVGKMVLHSFRYQFVFKLHFQYGHRWPFWILDSAAIFARVMGDDFFLNTSKSSNQVSNLTVLSVVTGPPDCTQLYYGQTIREFTTERNSFEELAKRSETSPWFHFGTPTEARKRHIYSQLCAAYHTLLSISVYSAVWYITNGVP